MTWPTIDAETLRSRLMLGAEFALLDPRETGVFARRHLLHAINLPLSRLELAIARLVPRPTTPIVICDAGEGLNERMAARLAELGWASVSILDGGLDAWEAAGFELFSGMNVPSKAFGEFIEHTYDTPRIPAEELNRRVQAGEKIVILDSRPFQEFHRMSIPGGIDCPGAELVHRVDEVVADPDTTVVVNCAGRTRSIIGCQSLRNAGVEKVVALENGTMGWHLAGLDLDHQQTTMAPDPSPEALARAKQRAAEVAKRFGVQKIDRATLDTWRTERDSRNLYIIDVRTPEEYAAGHLPDATYAPGGQLVQNTDLYIGVRQPRVVLVDDNGVRATMTAHWLIQMGWNDIATIDLETTGEPLVQGDEPIPVPGLDAAAVETVGPYAVEDLLSRNAGVVADLERSIDYRHGHIPGAWCVTRSRFAEQLPTLPQGGTLVLTSKDGALAKLAAAEAAALWDGPLQVVEGGTDGWGRAVGLTLETGLTKLAGEKDDAWYMPYETTTPVEDGMRAYLTWEVGLVEQIERDGTCAFKEFPAA